ncbi:MAG: hypothetical protein ACFFHV_19785 [Promethearchaeota archaeon]
MFSICFIGFTNNNICITQQKNALTFHNHNLKTQDTSLYTLLIDDMENINDWYEINDAETYLSTDCTQGSYSLNMTVNSTDGQQTIVKDLTGINVSRYNYLEFDLKITGSNFTAFSVEINQLPIFEYFLWWRTYRDNEWHHVKLDLRKPARVNMTQSLYQLIEFDLWGNSDYEFETFSVLIDNIYLSSSGIRLTTDLEYKDILPGKTSNFTVSLEHLHGVTSEEFILSLDKSRLFEFDAELNTTSLTVAPNKTKDFIVSFSAPQTVSIEETETVSVIAESASQPGKKYIANLTCGYQTYRDMIYFISDYHNSSYELYSMNPDGSNITRLTNNYDLEYTVVNLSPDGTLLAFTRSNETRNWMPGYNDNKEIWILNLTDMTEWQVTRNNCSDSHPDFSPDGQEVCYFSSNRFPGDNASVYACNIDGTNERQITPETHLCADPAWSKDGKKIAFNALPPGGTTMADFEIFTINASDGSDLTQLTNNGYTETDPYWSNDSQYLLYDRYIGPGDWNDLNNVFTDHQPWEIIEYNRTSSSETKLVETIGDEGAKYAIIPTYSPDNKKFLYIKYNDEYGIFRAFIDDRKGNTEELKLPFDVRWCDWGPRRAYVSRPDLTIESIIYSEANKKITTTVKNIGDTILTQATVEFSDGHPKSSGISIGSDKTINNLAPGESMQIISDSWSNPSYGTHFLYVFVTNSTPSEDFIQNNRDFIEIYITPSNGGGGDGDDDDSKEPIIYGFNIILIILITSLTSIYLMRKKLKKYY